MNLIDSHAHLDFEDFHDDFDAVLQRAEDAGVRKIINIGTDMDRSQAAIMLAVNFSNIYATVGVHPEEAANVNFETIHEKLLDLAKSSPRVVGIGETGLDYYCLPSLSSLDSQINYNSVDQGSHLAGDKIPAFAVTALGVKEKQIKLFKVHIEVAHHLGLPLVVHIRNGEDEEAVATAYEILEKSDYHRGVIHCFTLNADWARRFIDLGFCLGFTGIITYKNAEDIRESVKAVSLDRVLIETDCPFLAPQKYRGTRNEPAYVVEVAEKISEVRDLSLEKIAEQTTINAEKLFGI
jgi:TatD DNase family protein